MNQIHELLDLTKPLYHPQHQLSELVGIQRAIYDVLHTMKYSLNESRVQVSLESDTNLTVRISRGYLMQAIIIIITNALEAMKDAAIDEPHLGLQVVASKAFQGILIANNGPAIPDQYRKVIFEPSFSMRKSGQGLGLYVAHDLLATCNCVLELSEEGLPSLSGPCFRIRFDRRRVVGAMSKQGA
jgi:two-component system C4-dicarboxylate transport sensor histidine kinase DctB